MSYLDPRVRGESKIPDYKSSDIISKVKELKGYKGIPQKYWILGIQSKGDKFNRFDDMFYLFYGEIFIMRTTGTTNAGATGLKRYSLYNKNGTAIIKTNEWYYNLWKHGYHNGRMKALRQAKPILYYRDSNKNTRVEETGKLYKGYIGINFHTVTYSNNISFWRRIIGGWSVGCQVLNVVGDYQRFLKHTFPQVRTTYCLIKEW